MMDRYVVIRTLTRDISRSNFKFQPGRLLFLTMVSVCTSVMTDQQSTSLWREILQCSKKISPTIAPYSELDDGGDVSSSNIYMHESNSRFDETNYIIRSMYCNLLSQEHTIKCLSKWNKITGSISRLWLPKLYNNKKFRRDPSDCQYDWIYDGWDHSTNFILYSFTVHQHSCHTNVSLLGGSSFDIFAYSTLSTVGCTYTDTRNNIYQVQCQLPCLSHKCIEELQLHTDRRNNDNGNGNDCVHVTALLSHEHYDSFAEISLMTEEPQLRVVLQDNQTYCMATSASTKSTKTKTSTLREIESGNHQQQLQPRLVHTSPLPSWGSLLPPGVPVYSGIWVTNDMFNIHKQPQQHQQQHRSTQVGHVTKNHYTTNGNNNNQMEILIIDPSVSVYTLKRSENLTAYDLHKTQSRLVSYTLDSDIFLSNITRTPPLISMTPSSVLSDRYNFLPLVHFKTDNINDININSEQNYNSSHNNNNSNNNIISHILNGFNNSMSNDTTIKKRRFLFIGSSHMRYNFDGVIDFLFGSDVIRNIPRKHIDLIVRKLFRYDWTVLSSHLSDNLKNFCQLNISSDDGTDTTQTVFVQTGHWDLRYNGLRYITHNHTESPGYKLLQLFDDIFTGTLPCPSISHIVWMTTVPHPMCFSHKDDSECHQSRGQRYNANIRALNEFFLKGILSSYANATSTSTSSTTSTFTTTDNKEANHIRLSVIDAYSIIYPRIIYDENNEIINLNHYSSRNDGQRPMYTPGGAAVLQSMLSVIGDL
eukprot:gene8943-18502_t